MRRIAGLYRGGTTIPVELESTEWSFEVTEAAVVLEISQTFVNKEAFPISAEYIFPADQHAGIFGLSVLISGKQLEGVLISAVEAQAAYATAVSDHVKPVPVNSINFRHNPLMQVAVGKLDKGEKTTIVVKLANTMMFEDGWWKIAVPGSYSPETDVSAEWTVKMNIESIRKMSKFACDSLPLAFKVNKEGTNATAKGSRRIKGKLEDFVVRFKTDRINEPVVSYQRAETSNFEALISFVPPSKQTSADPQSNECILFVLDKSASMQGPRISLAREALAISLESLDSKSKFNVYYFDTVCTSIFPDPVECTKENVKKALESVSGLVCSGGSNLYDALNDVYNKVASPSKVFILTDGKVDDKHQAVQTIEKHERGNCSTRVFGIDTVDAELVTALGPAGAYELLYSSDPDHKAQVLKLLNRPTYPSMKNVCMKFTKDHAYTSVKSLMGGECFIAITYASEMLGNAVEVLLPNSSSADREKHVSCETETPKLYPGKSFNYLSEIGRMREHALWQGSYWYHYSRNYILGVGNEFILVDPEDTDHDADFYPATVPKPVDKLGKVSVDELAIREILQYQHSAELLIEESGFRQLVQEIADDKAFISGKRGRSEAPIRIDPVEVHAGVRGAGRKNVVLKRRARIAKMEAKNSALKQKAGNMLSPLKR